MMEAMALSIFTYIHLFDTSYQVVHGKLLSWPFVGLLPFCTANHTFPCKLTHRCIYCADCVVVVVVVAAGIVVSVFVLASVVVILFVVD